MLQTDQEIHDEISARSSKGRTGLGFDGPPVEVARVRTGDTICNADSFAMHILHARWDGRAASMPPYSHARQFGLQRERRGFSDAPPQGASHGNYNNVPPPGGGGGGFGGGGGAGLVDASVQEAIERAKAIAARLSGTAGAGSGGGVAAFSDGGMHAFVCCTTSRFEQRSPADR